MAGKTRVPLQVSEKFAERLKELQRKVRMTTGAEKSLRQLTDDIVNSEIFKDMESNLQRHKNNIENLNSIKIPEGI